ncbi:MAG: hypothetical protein AAFR77_22355 [Cyanobacteria bacterium J06631_2]
MPQTPAKEKLSPVNIASWLIIQAVETSVNPIETELQPSTFNCQVSEKKHLRNLNFVGGAE